VAIKPYSERVDAWASRPEFGLGNGVRINRRVLEDGRHHVWFYHIGFRVDRYDRDYEEANRAVWSWLVKVGWAR
jgi:hypothetical protein